MIHRDFANTVLEDFALGSGTPGTLYIALLVTMPSFNDSGEDLNEPTAGDYARLAVDNTRANFSEADNATITNASTFEFPVATNDWGLIRGYAICDAASGGVLRYSFRSSQKFVREGRRVVILQQSMTVRFRDV